MFPPPLLTHPLLFLGLTTTFVSPLTSASTSQHQFQNPILRSDSQISSPNANANAKNAPQILNTLLSSLRQFPSSIHHNGMSFIPASIPAGTLLYHGTHVKEAVKGMEWLAFEIEHAEIFARARGPGGPGRGPPGEGGPPGSPPRGPPPPSSPTSHKDGETPEEEDSHGYLHIYQTRHALRNILYIDGMSAAKCPLGTLDSTDLILLNNTLSSSASPKRSHHQNAKEDEPDKKFPPTHPNSDYARAQGLCLLANEWGLEGFIRMEAGFELILCDFGAHVDLVSANQRPDGASTGPHQFQPSKQKTGEAMEPEPETGSDQDQAEDVDIRGFEYLRALEQRYHDITANRIILDYSHMVSAFFYPDLNLTNPDLEKSNLPRLPTDDSAALSAIKAEMRKIFMQRSKDQDKIQKSKNSDEEAHAKLNWQGVADMVQTRYKTRLPFLSSPSTPSSSMLADIGVLLDVFIDYASPNLTKSREDCTMQYLLPVVELLSTKADVLIFDALKEVTGKICGVLFEVRGVLSSSPFELPESEVETDRLTVKGDIYAGEVEGMVLTNSKAKIVELMDYLNWAAWKECGKCGVDEVCFVAIWPWGGVEDHEKPSCVKVGETRGRSGYWDTRF